MVARAQKGAPLNFLDHVTSILDNVLLSVQVTEDSVHVTQDSVHVDSRIFAELTCTESWNPRALGARHIRDSEVTFSRIRVGEGRGPCRYIIRDSKVLILVKTTRSMGFPKEHTLPHRRRLRLRAAPGLPGIHPQSPAPARGVGGGDPEGLHDAHSRDSGRAPGVGAPVRRTG